MRRRAFFAILIVVLLCFWLGVLSSLLSDGSQQDLARTLTATYETASLRTPTEENKSRRTFLVLGVDDLLQEHPRLLAIWLIVYRVPEADVVLIGFPLNWVTSVQPNASLRELFSWDREHGPSDLFMSSLVEASPYGEPEQIIIMDETAFATAVDYLGGIPNGGRFMDGEEVVSFQRLIADEPEALLVTQSNMLDRLRYQLPRLGTTPDLSPLLGCIPDHCQLTIDAPQLILMASPLLPVNPEAVHVRLLPSLLEARSSPSDGGN